MPAWRIIDAVELLSSLSVHLTDSRSRPLTRKVSGIHRASIPGLTPEVLALARQSSCGSDNVRSIKTALLSGAKVKAS